MKRIFILLLIFLFTIKPLHASIKEKIILNLKNTNNLTFKFEQKINDLFERGECTIKYPKKIYCSYNNLNKKIMVSNGKSLVIKSDKNLQYYRYPLESTPLALLLDKEFIIKNISKLREELVNEKFYMFSISEKNKILNLFFEKDSLNLIGWQTEDVYQNLTVTYIFDLKINNDIDKKIFKLPKMH